MKSVRFAHAISPLYLDSAPTTH